MHHAAAVLYPQAMATSVSLPMEILHAASQTASVAHRGQPQVEFKLLGPDRRMLRLASGIALKPDVALEQAPPLDLLVLPAIWRNPLPAVAANRGIFGLLRDYAASGTRICSVGSGSFLLAEAGLLDGKPATTHWNYLDTFRERYPSVELKSRHLITQADNIYCVGSVNSIADLMVHIIEEWLGSRIARAVENQFSPEIRRSFSAAAYQNEADSSHHDELVAEAQQWLQNHLANPVRSRHLLRGLKCPSARSTGASNAQPVCRHRPTCKACVSAVPRTCSGTATFQLVKSPGSSVSGTSATSRRCFASTPE